MTDDSTNADRDAAHDDDVVVERVGEELLVYDPRTDEAHQLTPLAVTAFEESTASGLSRRDALRRVALAGAGAAAAVPLVKSIVAPTAAHAGTTPCFPDGSGCSINAQCCSNNCNAGVCGPPL